MPPKHIFADTSDAKSATGKVEYNIVFDVSLIARCNDGAYKLLKIRSSGRYHDPGGGKAHIKYVFIFSEAGPRTQGRGRQSPIGGPGKR